MGIGYGVVCRVWQGWPPTLCMTDGRLTKLPDYCRLCLCLLKLFLTSFNLLLFIICQMKSEPAGNQFGFLAEAFCLLNHTFPLCAIFHSFQSMIFCKNREPHIAHTKTMKNKSSGFSHTKSVPTIIHHTSVLQRTLKCIFYNSERAFQKVMGKKHSLDSGWRGDWWGGKIFTHALFGHSHLLQGPWTFSQFE